MSRILLIDDDPSVLDILGQMLSASGHAVVTACDGRAGQAAFERDRPDLVITDIIMPDREGIETIKALRAIDPAVPIIAISGGGRTGNMDFLTLAAKLGANRTLAKPFSRATLNESVRELLGGQQAETSGKSTANPSVVDLPRG